MGTGSHSKLAAPQLPSRPFDATRRICFHGNLIPLGGDAVSKRYPTKTTLQQLILRQDWQRVLIRANMYPEELRQKYRISLFGVHIETLPLALALTLNPPEVVVELFLKHFIDATAMAITPCASHQNHGPRGRTFWNRTKLNGKFRKWREKSRGSFSSLDRAVHGAISRDDLVFDFVDEDIEVRKEQGKLLLPHQVLKTKDVDSKLRAEEKQVLKESHSGASSLSSKSLYEDECSSDDSSLGQQGFILQLSPSGGIASLPLNISKETESTTTDTSEKSESGLFCVEWDLNPLLQEVASKRSVLPIHIACLFEASPEVVGRLLKAYPLGAQKDVAGMLPIHWVSAGWNLPAIFEPPPESSMAFSLSHDKPGPFGTLQALCQAAPGTLQMRSKNHSMTPQEYVEECMKEGSVKEACLELLSAEGEVHKTHTVPSAAAQGHKLSISSAEETLLFTNSSDLSSLPPEVPGNLCPTTGLCSLIANNHWTQALEVVEDDPSVAQKWYYGVDPDGVRDKRQNVVWKRLPIHMACIHNAPLGLLEVLLEAYPKSTSVEDENGLLPLHLLCTAGAPLASIKIVLLHCPEATKAVDMLGRSALHFAVLNQAPYNVIQFLLQTDPEGVVVGDKSSKTPIDYAMEGCDESIRELLSMILKLLKNHSHHLLLS